MQVTKKFPDESVGSARSFSRAHWFLEFACSSALCAGKLHSLLKTTTTLHPLIPSIQTDTLSQRKLIREQTPLISYLIHQFSCFTCLVITDTIWHLLKEYWTHAILQYYQEKITPWTVKSPVQTLAKSFHDIFNFYKQLHSFSFVNMYSFLSLNFKSWIK